MKHFVLTVPDVTSSAKRNDSRNEGFSLVELLIAMAIGLIVAIAIGSLFVQNMSLRHELQKKGERLENGRFAVDVLRDDLSLAGYYGGYWPVAKVWTYEAGASATVSGTWAWNYDDVASATVAWQNPGPCEAVSLGWDTASSAVGVPRPVYAYPEGVTTTFPCLSERDTGSHILLIRRASTQAVALGTAAGDAYLQVSGCYGAQESGQAYDAVPVVIASQSAAFTLKQGNCSSAAPIRKYIARAYYVGCSGGCNGTNVPQLRRADLGLSGGVLSVTSSPIAEGIEHFRVQFGIDSNGDGAMDGAYSDPDEVESAGNWNRVVSARILVVARDLSNSPGLIDQTSFGWPGEAPIIASATGAAAGFRRQAFTTTVNLTNLGPRRE